MAIDGLHEKDIFKEGYPFKLAINTEEYFDYPLHWHKAVELIYVLENIFSVNVNGCDKQLQEKDIYFIASGEIHGFNTRKLRGKRYFIQFDISMLDGFQDMEGIRPLLSSSRMIPAGDAFHNALEEQI